MLRSFRRYLIQKKCSFLYIQRQTFLTHEYKCTEDWNTQISSSILKRVNLNDFYNVLDQHYSSKGVISAIDVDMFANAVNEAGYLEELKDLLHKLRLSAETGNTLESTHHATIRNFIEHGNIQDLVQILKDPINFGIFLDYYSANILLDKLLVAKNFELAANVASVYMLQEDFSNEITNTMSQYACYKYLSEYKEKEEHPTPETTKKEKVEEIKIRVKFLRNPYFDDHFDITDLRILSGKTLAWISKNSNDNVSYNLQVIGWLFYQKHNKLLLLCEELLNMKSFKLYPEVLELIIRESKNLNDEAKNVLDQCIDKLKKAPLSEINLEDSVKNSIENAINKIQNKDISVQKEVSLLIGGSASNNIFVLILINKVEAQ